MIVELDPLYADPADAARIVDLCHRFGRYALYASREKIDIDLGRGLPQRYDSILNLLRTGGARGTDPSSIPPRVLAARTSYFREEYAYGTEELVDGIDRFLHHPPLAEAATRVHDLPVVEPAIAFANLMVPGQELAVHTDVPEFRGANRKLLPQWLLVVMHHSGLFEPWRLPIATGIAWFQDSDEGALRYWPDGPGGAPVVHHVRANTAMVLDTDSVFHGVDPVGVGAEPPLTDDGSTLRPDADGSGRWVLADPQGAPVAHYDWDDLRFSISWKAYCFADEADRERWRTGSEDLREAFIVDRLVRDLVEHEVVPAGVAVDRDLGLLMIDHYVRYPAAPAAA